MNRLSTIGLAIVITFFLITSSSLLTSSAMSQRATTTTTTLTPIKHIVVIFQENTSFDHYFGTYPNATDPGGEPRFIADPHIPTINGLTEVLLKNNPNGNSSINPFRFGIPSNNM
jgi:phospholipase C